MNRSDDIAFRITSQSVKTANERGWVYSNKFIICSVHCLVSFFWSLSDRTGYRFGWEKLAADDDGSMTRAKVLKWYSEKFPFLFALIPCHCHSNFNPFEDFISQTHELHLFYASKRIECVQRKSYQWWILKWVKLLSEFGTTTWAACVLKCLWGNENRRVYQIRRHTHALTNQIRKHVVHIFFRSVFSSTRRPNTCSSSRFSIGLHHPIWNICRRNTQRKECTLHTTHIFRKCDRMRWFDIASISARLCIAQGVTHVRLQRVHAQMFDCW